MIRSHIIAGIGVLNMIIALFGFGGCASSPSDGHHITSPGVREPSMDISEVGGARCLTVAGFGGDALATIEVPDNIYSIDVYSPIFVEGGPWKAYDQEDVMQMLPRCHGLTVIRIQGITGNVDGLLEAASALEGLAELRLEGEDITYSIGSLTQFMDAPSGRLLELVLH